MNSLKTLSMMAALTGSSLLGTPALAGGPAGGGAPDIEQTSGQFVGRIWVTDIDGFGAAHVWRVYVNVGVGNQVTTIFGNMANPLHISTSSGIFYQDPLGADNEPNQTLVDLLPDTLGNDSYVTIGNAAIDSGELATSLSAFFPTGAPGGDPWGTGALEDEASWFRTPDDPLTNADVDGLVLIGQFTVLEGASLDGIVNIAHVIDGQFGTKEGLAFNFVGFVNCPGDTNSDGQVDVTDLVNVINTWGTDGMGDGFNADTDGNGVVDVQDLVAVINNWGPCP